MTTGNKTIKKNDLLSIIERGDIDIAFDMIIATAYSQGIFNSELTVNEFREFFSSIKEQIETNEKILNF